MSTALALVPDCGPAIRRAAVAVPPGLFAQPERLALMQRLCITLGAEMEVVVLGERRDSARLQEWVSRLGAGARPAPVAPDGALRERGIWLRDSFLPARQAGRAVHLVAADEPGAGIGRALAEAVGAEARPLPLRLDGGNCLVGPDFRLVGCDSVTETARAFLRSDRNAAEAAIAALDRRPLSVVGFTPPGDAEAPPHPERQPWFHLDQFLTVTGRRQGTRPVLVAAEPLATADPDGPRHPHLAARLDWTLLDLRKRFCVIRNPVPIVPRRDGGEALPRLYNNVLLQNDPPVVWLPQFGDAEPTLARADARNAALWEGLGFRVIPIPGWSACAGAWGALRCATQVLER